MLAFSPANDYSHKRQPAGVFLFGRIRLLAEGSRLTRGGAVFRYSPLGVNSRAVFSSSLVFVAARCEYQAGGSCAQKQGKGIGHASPPVEENASASGTTSQGVRAEEEAFTAGVAVEPLGSSKLLATVDVFDSFTAHGNNSNGGGNWFGHRHLSSLHLKLEVGS
jgi:hypothetical protein